jgi:hypothetical protein
MSAEARAGRGHPSCRRLTKGSRIWNRRIIAELSKDVSDAQQSLHLNATVLIKAKLDKHAMRLEEAVMLLDVPIRDLLLFPRQLRPAEREMPRHPDKPTSE